VNDLTILGIAGSLRKRSFSRALLRAMSELAPEGLTIETADIGALPHYDQDRDVDGERPEAVEAFKQAITDADGVLIVTPEYNHSVPGVLKNAIDWASRPGFRAPFTRKPVAFAGISPGAHGAARAQIHLENILLGMLSIPFPHRGVAVGGAPGKFDDDLQLTDEGTRDFVSGFLSEYGDWLRER
jgi:chromate reductase